MEASDCEIVQLGFREGHAQLLSIDSLFCLVHWDLQESVTPTALKRVQLPEDANFGFSSCLYMLGFHSSDPENVNHAYIGTTTGNIYFYSLNDKALMQHSVKRQQLLQTKNARICDIRAHPLKPHRLLLVYKDVAVAVYSMNKHEFIQHLKGKVAIAAEWVFPKGELFAVVMASGYV